MGNKKANLVTVRCSTAPGFDGVFRAGRKWPGSGRLVELLDQDEDREEANGQPLGVGRKTLTALRGDHRFSLNADGALDELVSLRKRVIELEPAGPEAEELRKQVETLTAKVAELTAANTALEAQLAEANKAKGAKQT